MTQEYFCSHETGRFRYPGFIFFPVVAFIVLLSSSPAVGQTNPEQAKLKHSPDKATLYAAILPGLGQAYNRKYWKIPIVYAGFGVGGYSISFNRDKYRLFKEAYRYVSAGDTSPTDNPYVTRYNAYQLQVGRDYYRRNLEISYIGTGVWYLLTIVDAIVDAHLFDYDIDENLSLSLAPDVITLPAASGQVSAISLTLCIKPGRL